MCNIKLILLIVAYYHIEENLNVIINQHKNFIISSEVHSSGDKAKKHYRMINILLRMENTLPRCYVPTLPQSKT